MKPKQLRLPFDAPVKSRSDQQLTEILYRLGRMESRLVQLMKHVGMRSDGRAPLPADQND